MRILNNGTAVTDRQALNFIGATFTDDLTNNATQIDVSSEAAGITLAANQSATWAAGTGGLDASAASGAFKTSTGTNTIGGATVFAANKGVTVTSGTSAFDFSGGSGIFKTSTGVNTFGGSSNSMTNALAIAPATNQLALGAAGHVTTINSAAPAAATQTIVIPDSGVASDTVVLLALAQTLTSKTLTAPIINGITSASGNVDFSGSAGTIKFPTGGAGAALPMNSNKLTGLAAGSAAGDSIRYEQAGMQVSARCTGTIGAATKYMNGPGGGAVAASQVVIAVVTRAAVLRNLNAALDTAPGGADTVVFTVQNSSNQGSSYSDTTLTCTISASGKSASDTAHTPAVSAGDYLAVKMVSGNVTAAGPAVGFEIL